MISAGDPPPTNVGAFLVSQMNKTEIDYKRKVAELEMKRREADDKKGVPIWVGSNQNTRLLKTLDLPA